jgi:hypothetical protein
VVVMESREAPSNLNLYYPITRHCLGMACDEGAESVLFTLPSSQSIRREKLQAEPSRSLRKSEKKKSYVGGYPGSWRARVIGEIH